MDRWHSPARRLLLLPEQLQQRNERRRRQSHAAPQSREQPGEAVLNDDLAGTLEIGPDRLAGLGRDLRVALHAGEHGLSDRRIDVVGYVPSQLQWRGISYAESKTECQPTKHFGNT
jgi:hypothetical protein